MKMLDSRLDAMGTDRALSIGKRMREARKKAGYTIRELAERMQISPTHLNRIEMGERLMDSVEKMILFCDICHVPIEEFLILAGMKIPPNNTAVRRAFPDIQTVEQERAISAFADTITSNELTSEEISQVVNSAIAFAEFCKKNRR